MIGVAVWSAGFDSLKGPPTCSLCGRAGVTGGPRPQDETKPGQSEALPSGAPGSSTDRTMWCFRDEA